jgi:outer membrane receptor for ferrienterochelin and colicin
MKNIFPKGLSALAMLTVASSAMMAQESTGTILGQVKTKSGAILEGVQIRISSPNLQGVRALVSDASGAFRAPLLPPGPYRIQVSKDGFTGPDSNVDLKLGQVFRVDLQMVEASASATVVVVAEKGIVDKTDPKTSTSVTSETFDALPRFQRGLDSAALLAPGVTVGGFSDGGRISVRGSQGFGTRLLLNGSDVSDNVFGGTTGRSYYVDDSIEEVQVIQSPVNAKYGNFTGGVVNAVTKSGSNEFTGIIRANLNRSDWRAVAPRGGYRPVLAAGNQPNEGSDIWTREYTVFLAGPIVKDTLWFTFSTKLSPPSATANNLSAATGGDTQNIDGSDTVGTSGGNVVPIPGIAEPGKPFFITANTTFYELKLTWAINQNHTLEFGGNKATNQQQNRFYVGSVDPRTLIPQKNENSYWSLGYRGLLTNSLNLEARVAKKHQLLSAGGDPANGDPIFYLTSTQAFRVFNNGIFNGADGGDNRDIVTATGNLTWFSPSTAAGSHQVEVGFEYLEQKRAAANDQAPNSRDFTVDGVTGTTAANVGYNIDPANQIGEVDYYITDRNYTKNKVSSLYVNDIWTITDQWQVDLGLRYDKTEAADTTGTPTIQVARTSPRFQAKFDPFRDQSWVVSASWAKYTGRLIDGFTNRFSLAGNPITETYFYQGPVLVNGTYAQATDLTQYPKTLANLDGSAYSSPLNRAVNKSIKPPSVDEAQIGLRRNFRDGSFIGINYISRTYKDFFNDFFEVGRVSNVPLITATGTVAKATEYWDNDNRIKRDYKALEIEFSSRISPTFTMGGNYAYSVLKGNGTGSEGGNPAIQGDALGDYDATHAKYGRDTSFYAPYGYLVGDQPNRARVFGTWTQRNSKGSIFETTLLFNYTAGSSYSLTRANRLEARADGVAATDPAASSYGNNYTRYFGPRGIGRVNDTYSFDLKARAEFPVVNKLRYFLEFTVTGLFNAWQVAGNDTSGRAGGSGASPTGYVATSSPLSGFYATPYASSTSALTAGNASGFGTYSFSSMAGGRTVQLSTGFKW